MVWFIYTLNALVHMKWRLDMLKAIVCIPVPNDQTRDRINCTNADNTFEQSLLKGIRGAALTNGDRSCCVKREVQFKPCILSYLHTPGQLLTDCEAVVAMLV